MKVINVRIGELKIAKDGEVLKALLGSCVGIGILWRRRGICALAHCLLPECPVPTFEIGGRFVDQAIPSLMALMKLKQADIPEVEVVLAGGGNMTSPGPAGGSELIGALNFRIAERELKRLGFRVIRADCGGVEGRKIIIQSVDCTFRIEKIPRLTEAA